MFSTEHTLLKLNALIFNIQHLYLTYGKTLPVQHLRVKRSKKLEFWLEDTFKTEFKIADIGVCCYFSMQRVFMW
jgi:hypothetical protein